MNRKWGTPDYMYGMMPFKSLFAAYPVVSSVLSFTQRLIQRLSILCADYSLSDLSVSQTGNESTTASQQYRFSGPSPSNTLDT